MSHGGCLWCLKGPSVHQTTLLVPMPYRAAYGHWSLVLPEISEITSLIFMNKIQGKEGCKT